VLKGKTARIKMGLLQSCVCPAPDDNEMELKRLQEVGGCTSDNTPWLTLSGTESPCKVVSVYDADTVTVALPFGGSCYQVKCRLKGIDAAEIRTKNEEEKKVGLDGKKFLANLILEKTVWIRCGDWGKYGGRMIGELFLTHKDMLEGRSINEMVVKQGLAYYYDGKKKKAFEEWYVV
jgi:endonuclease YncB( thermonuclease family)